MLSGLLWFPEQRFCKILLLQCMISHLAVLGQICLLITQIFCSVCCCAGGLFGSIQSEEPFTLCWTGPLCGSACSSDGGA